MELRKQADHAGAIDGRSTAFGQVVSGRDRVPSGGSQAGLDLSSSSSREEQAAAVARISASLAKVSSGGVVGELAGEMSLLVEELRVASTRPGNLQLQRIDAERLLSGLGSAHERLRVSLVGHYCVEELALNIEICRDLVRFWSSGDVRRQARGAFIEDAAALAFVFKNTMANLCTLQWLEARWDKLVAQRADLIRRMTQTEMRGTVVR